MATGGPIGNKASRRKPVFPFEPDATFDPDHAPELPGKQ